MAMHVLAEGKTLNKSLYYVVIIIVALMFWLSLATCVQLYIYI